MSEKLGSALLDIRTNDAGFEAGINKAQRSADRLGQTFDRTGDRAEALGRDMVQAGQQARQAGASFDAAGGQVINSAAAQRAGMQQLGMQLNDMATMYAMGARPMQIFASQAGQMTGALSLMGGTAGRVGAFFAGPWGVALTTGAIVLAPFLAKLWDTEEAMQAVELGADSLGDAQGVLGQIFDMTTGRIANQNEMLRINARMMALNMQNEAMARRQSARSTLMDAQRPGAVFQSQLGTAEVRGEVGREAGRVTQLLQRVGRGEITREQAIQLSSSIDFGQTRVSRDAFVSALRDAAWANEADRLAGQINQSLDNNELAPGLRTPGRPDRPDRSRTTRDNSAQIAQRYQGELTGAQQEILQLQIQMARTAAERASLEGQALDLAMAANRARITGDEDLSQAQKAELLARLDTRESLERQAIALRQAEEEARQALELNRGSLQLRQDDAQLQARLATTRQERLDAELEILRLTFEQRRLEAEAVLASQSATDAQKAVARALLARLPGMQAAEAGLLGEQYASPGQRYLREIGQLGGNITDELEQVTVDGLGRLNDEIARTMLMTQSLGRMFKNVANQIIGDLLRIAIQRNITAPLANMLFPASGGGGLQSLFAGFFADGGLIPHGQFGIVGERGPELAIATPGGTMIMPNSSVGGSGGAAGSPIVRLQVTPGQMFDVRVQEIAGQVSIETVQAVGPALVEAAGAETMRQLSRERM